MILSCAVTESALKFYISKDLRIKEIIVLYINTESRTINVLLLENIDVSYLRLFASLPSS